MSASSRPKVRSAASIILRGANDFLLDEMERSLHDSLCAVKRVIESRTVVAGGGAVEAALSIYLENFATSLVSLPLNLAARPTSKTSLNVFRVWCSQQFHIVIIVTFIAIISWVTLGFVNIISLTVSVNY